MLRSVAEGKIQWLLLYPDRQVRIFVGAEVIGGELDVPGVFTFQAAKLSIKVEPRGNKKDIAFLQIRNWKLCDCSCTVVFAEMRTREQGNSR